MRHSWQIWLVVALMLLALAGAVLALIQPDPVEAQVFGWWGRSFLLMPLTGLAAVAAALGLAAIFLRKPWSLTLLLIGAWVPAIVKGSYLGIVFSNFDDYRALTASANVDNMLWTCIKLLDFQAGQYPSMLFVYLALALSFAIAAGITVLAVMKRGEIQA